MKNKILTTFILCIMLITSIRIPIAATEESEPPIAISPLYTHISYTTTSLANVSGKASCTAKISAYSSSSDLKAFIYLERYSNGTWSTYISDYTTKTGSSLTLSKTFSVSSGTYRLKASYYANGENTIKYSATVTF